ncbi:MAG: DUF1858 domain-containing protein [Candidatus Anstonellaceae archaeon]
MAAKITKDMQIGELIMNYPETVEILLEYGFHCIGCALSPYETIEQGAAMHGYSDREIENLVKRLNDAVNAEKPKRSKAKKAGDQKESQPAQA